MVDETAHDGRNLDRSPAAWPFEAAHSALALEDKVLPGTTEGSKEVVAKEILYEDLADHSAVRAWSRLRAVSREPERIEVLQEESRSSVYRLSGIGPTGSVIAKRCRRERAAVERLMYEEALPAVSVNVPRFYGCIDDDRSADKGERSWLFMEDVGGLRFSPSVASHARLVANWLAAFHTAAEQVGSRLVDQLPDRGPASYREHLDSIQRGVPEAVNYLSQWIDQEHVLKDTLLLCESLDAHWNDVECFSDRMPRALVHGDCLPKNLHLCLTKDEVMIVPIDWGSAGWGLPAADLGQSTLTFDGGRESDPDYSAYLAGVSPRWSDLALQDIRQMADLGKMFWCLYVIDVTVEELKQPWAHVQTLLDNLTIYAAIVAESLRSVGWSE